MSSDIVSAIDEELEQLRTHEYMLKTSLDDVHKDMNKLERARKILTGESQTATRSNKATKSNGSKNPPKITGRIHDAIKEFAPDIEFSSSDIANMYAEEASEGTVNAALNYLNEIGAINLVRRAGKTGTKRFYKAALNATVTESN